MATFPDSRTIKPQPGYESWPIENVRRNPAEAGDTQIRDVWGVTKYFAEFEMELETTDSNTLLAFFDANRATTFSFYDFDNSRLYTAENIGTGTGAELNFTIPAKETTGTIYAEPLVYVDGVLKTVATHYNIDDVSGALGQDRVVFTGGNAPANGLAVTVTYTGRHIYTCEFVKFEARIVATTMRKQFSIRVEEAF